MGTETTHLTAGYCATTGTYRSRHSPATEATATDTSFPSYLFSRLRAFPPDRPAFVDTSTGASLSFAGLRALSLKAASALGALGLRRGHVVLLVAPNSLHFPALSLAVLAVGAVLSAANPLLTSDELAGQAQDSEPFLALTTADLAPKLRKAQMTTTTRVVLIDELLAGVDGHDEWAACASSDDGDHQAALLFYSSGTTGRSKGVVCTHGNAVAMAASLERLWRRLDNVEDDVYGCVVPMFHMFGFSAFVLGTAAMGATTVLVPGRFSADKLMAAMADYGVTRLLVVPPMVASLAKVAAAWIPRLRLREVVSSGAPLLRHHVARFRSCFPRVSLGQVTSEAPFVYWTYKIILSLACLDPHCYGLTETTGIITMCDLPSDHDNDGLDKPDGSPPLSSLSIGRLAPCVEARIVDVESGEALPPYRTGELWLRGASVMLKELIKYKAYQVAPAELEDVLAMHPGIQDAAVAPYPDDEAGEIPVACVVRKPESHHLQAQDVLSFVQHKVAPYKMIRKVVFVDAIPRSPSGKILRAHLKSFLRTVVGAEQGRSAGPTYTLRRSKI
ncbi:hypothetical protein EJB05_54389, partial [Eragrostis curvula]